MYIYTYTLFFLQLFLSTNLSTAASFTAFCHCSTLQALLTVIIIFDNITSSHCGAVVNCADP